MNYFELIKGFWFKLLRLEFGFFSGCLFGAFSLLHFQQRAFDSGFSWEDAVAVGGFLEGVLLGFVWVVLILFAFDRLRPLSKKSAEL